MFQPVVSCLPNISYKLYYVLEGGYVWDVDYSYIEDWLDSLDDETVASIFASLKILQEIGPVLGRPLVDTLEGASHSNLKELRPASLRGFTSNICTLEEELMDKLEAYLEKRGIADEQMDVARHATQATIDAYKLREARKASHMTQVELAEAMGVSQNRISRMENGDIGSMSLDTISRYIEAVGGTVSLIADLPTGQVSLV